MATTTTRNLSSGRWAVALVGWRQWRQDAAAGDGITTALHALVGRYDTREEAEAEAARLNDAQPGTPPGAPSVPEFDARPYRVDDYLSRQQREQGQRRACDRRIASGW